MRHITLSLFLAAFGTLANAQVTITQNEMPHAGDALLRTQAAPNPLLNYSNTGANYTWNYTNLVAQGQDVRNFQTVGSTNIIYSLVFADIGFNGNRANHATQGMDVPFYDILPIENPYTFYFRSSSVYRKVGYGAEVAGIPLPITMGQQDVVYQLPLNFGNTSSSNSSYSIDIPTLAYYGYSQQRTNVVDGWGTINTPAGSFNALRVKTTIAGRDTIQVDQVSLGFAIDRPVIKEYKWLTPGRRVPVLQINTSTIFGAEIITEVFFYDEPRSLNVTTPLASNFCPGQQFALNYTRTGVFNPGSFLVTPNVFRAQLSDANGSFAAPVNIGSLTSTQSGTINATIPANTPPGTAYRVRVIATNPAFTGTANSFNITIGTTPQAVASAGGPLVFCDGASVLLNALTAPAFNYQWQLGGVDIPEATASSLEVLSSGSYRLQVTTTCGTATSAPVVAVVNALPQHALVAPADLSTCVGVPVLFTATDISGLSGLTYQWLQDGQSIDGATTLELSTADAGSYALLVSDPATTCNYTTEAAMLELETVSAPLAQANGSSTICDGSSVLLETADSGSNTLQWYLDGSAIAGAVESEFLATLAGDYTATATSVGGCSSDASSPITVTLLGTPDVPVVSASGPTEFCDGGSVFLNAAGSPGSAFEWSLNGVSILGAGGAGYAATSTGSYTAIATNADGCSSLPSDPTFVEVELLPSTPFVTALDATTFCVGGSVVLVAVGDAGTTYEWFNGASAIQEANTPQMITSMSGSYTVVSRSVAGCASEASLATNVNVLPLPNMPQLNANGPTTFCVGGSVTMMAQGDPDDALQWTLDGVDLPGATSPELLVDVAGGYAVIATNSEGCTSMSGIATVLIQATPEPAVLSAASGTTVCQGASVLLQADAEAGVSFTWSKDGELIPEANDATYEATVAGDYSVVLTSTAGCGSDVSNEVTVTVNALPPSPTIVLAEPAIFCEGASTTMVAVADPGLGFQWTLNGEVIVGATANQHTVSVEGVYSVIVSNTSGCTAGAVADVTVVVNALPNAPSITQQMDSLFASGPGAFQWYLNGVLIPDATADLHVAEVNGSYTVTTTNAQGCSATSAVTSVTNVGIAEAAGVVFSVYPNPSSGTFTIRLEGTPTSKSFFTLYDATGKVVQQGGLVQTMTSVELTDPHAGMYFLQLVHGDAVSTQRIVVQR